MRWDQVAHLNGRIMHALAQFDRIATPTGSHTDGRLATDVQAPSPGDLPADQLQALCAILRGHMPVAQRCWYALWEGWGELSDAGMTVSFTTDREGSAPDPAPQQWQLDLRAATFELPGRRYYLFTGELDEATHFGRWVTRDWFLPRSPNLFWPDDRSWCVASEIDFDSTLVAGPAELVDDILRSQQLEAWEVQPQDSLAWDGDVINPM